jgi:hypothetical protein
MGNLVGWLGVCVCICVKVPVCRVPKVIRKTSIQTANYKPRAWARRRKLQRPGTISREISLAGKRAFWWFWVV